MNIPSEQLQSSALVGLGVLGAVVYGVSSYMEAKHKNAALEQERKKDRKKLKKSIKMQKAMANDMARIYGKKTNRISKTVVSDSSDDDSDHNENTKIKVGKVNP